MIGFAFAGDAAEKVASLFGGTILYIAISVGLMAFCVLAVTFFRTRLEDAAMRAQQRGHSGIWLGLLNYVVIIGIVLAVAGFGAPDPVVGILFLILLILSLCAFAIEAQEIGQRIALLRENSTPLTTILLGAVTFNLAFLVPILGQILWVILLARGLGALVGSLRQRTSKTNVMILFLAGSICFYGIVPSSEAVREGTANANIMIRRYERKQAFGKAALWREAAAQCLDVISTPLSEITLEYAQRRRDVDMVEKLKEEIADIERQREEHLRRSKLLWEKATENQKELDAERAKIREFIGEWVAYYPKQFYNFGIYQNSFREPMEALKDQQKYRQALLLEAEASDMCAKQYDRVTIQYFRNAVKQAKDSNRQELVKPLSHQAELYQQVRDGHLRRSATLRALAEKNPQYWPVEADNKEFRVPQSKHKLTAEKAIQAARTHAKVRQIFREHRNIKEFAWFQGFCWTVSYYTQDFSDLAIIFVDDETGKVTDVLISPGNLEEREWEEQ